jgi:hypothetical protein
MRMPCVCRAHRLGRLCCISSRFDRALLAACRRPPTNALSTISSRRARCTEPRSATHRCAQGVAALIGVVAPSEALRSLLSHTWWRWAWACVNARGCAGRASEAGDAIGAQDDRALPRRWQARPLRPRACGGGAAPAGPTAIVVVGLGVWGWPKAQSTRPEPWVPTELQSVACGRTVGEQLCYGCGTLFPARSAVSRVPSALRRARPSRAVPALLGGHIFLHVLPTVLLAPCWASGAEPPRVVRVVTGHRACPAVCSEAL